MVRCHIQPSDSLFEQYPAFYPSYDGNGCRCYRLSAAKCASNIVNYEIKSVTRIGSNNFSNVYCSAGKSVLGRGIEGNRSWFISRDRVVVRCFLYQSVEFVHVLQQLRGRLLPQLWNTAGVPMIVYTSHDGAQCCRRYDDFHFDRLQNRNTLPTEINNVIVEYSSCSTLHGTQ